jgi:tRNA(Arg) A34 adenosine deaminase TadA
MVLATAQIRLPEWLASRRLPSAPAPDEACVRLAIEIARENVARRGGGPFGAVVRGDASGEILSVGVNLAQPSGNPVLHAEVVALSLAGPALAASGGVTLYSSCEPCIMCLGALHWAGAARIVWAALREDAEAVGFIEGAGCDALRVEMAARGVIFEPGVMRAEGAQVLRDYIGNGGVIYGPSA